MRFTLNGIFFSYVHFWLWAQRYFSFAGLGSVMVGEAADLRHSCEHRRALTISEGGSEGANRPNTAGHDGTPVTCNHQAAAN